MECVLLDSLITFWLNSVALEIGKQRAAFVFVDVAFFVTVLLKPERLICPAVSPRDCVKPTDYFLGRRSVYDFYGWQSSLFLNWHN